MTTRGYAAYQHSVTHTTQRKDDILMQLYDGALNFVRLAQRAVATRQLAAKGEQISKAIAVISELDCALEHEIGGEITANLSRLYHYMIDRLTYANIHHDPAALDEVNDLIGQLRQAFAAAIQEQLTLPPGPETLLETASKIHSTGLDVAI